MPSARPLPFASLWLLLCTSSLSTAGCDAGLVGSDESAVVGELSLWPTNPTPAHPIDSDTAAAELGMRIRTDVDGVVTGVRFYKSTQNTGVHTGTLWSASGTRLATVTFQGESASGWQTARFATPVAIRAGRSYVISYHTNVGHYAGDNGYFASRSVDTAPLHAPADSSTAHNGVYRYGASGFPTQSWQASNYWVDLLFKPSATSPLDAGTNSDASSSTDAAPPTDSGNTPSDSGTPSTDSSTPSTDSGTLTQSRNCGPNPHLCGYPDTTNTGVPTGVTLRAVPDQVSSGTGWHYDSRFGGYVVVDGAGAVVDGLLLDGHNINVAASNVTIKNCRIIATGETWGVGLQHANNVTVQDSEVYSPTRLGPDRLLTGIKDVYGDTTGTRALRNEIYHTATAVQIGAGLIEDNYIHDLGFVDGDHVNGTTSNGSTQAMTIRHNTIFNPEGQTDAISLFQDFGLESNRLIDNNLVAGGGYCIYGGAGGYGLTSNIRITNNRIAVIHFPNGGSYGWLAHFDQNGPGNLLAGNVWDDTGAAAEGN